MNRTSNFYHIIIFILSLGGVFLTFHMHFLATFEQDCSARCCTSIFTSFKVLGISNIYWGMIYYFTLTFLTIAPILFNIHYKIITLGRNYLIVGGFIYSIILVSYQMFTNDCFCQLCLASGVICTGLLLVLIKSRFNYSYKKINFKFIYPLALFLCAGFIILDYNNINQIEEKTTLEDRTLNIPISNSVVLGNPNAKITIIEWTDFQ